MAEDNKTTNTINANETNATNDTIKPTHDKRLDNLKPIPFDQLTQEEHKRIASMGGKKSGEVRKARKTAQELLTKILTTNLTDEQIEECLGNASTLLGGDKTSYNVMLVKALQMAISGDSKALSFVRDTVGDMPTTKTEVKADITESDKALIETVKNRLLG